MCGRVGLGFCLFEEARASADGAPNHTDWTSLDRPAFVLLPSEFCSAICRFTCRCHTLAMPMLLPPHCCCCHRVAVVACRRCCRRYCMLLAPLLLAVHALLLLAGAGAAAGCCCDWGCCWLLLLGTKKKMNVLGIEPKLQPWKGCMLPLHHTSGRAVDIRIKILYIYAKHTF